MSVLIIGGGIAGLSTALHASDQGLGPVVVVERERAPFSLSSARNAAIFRPLELHPGLVELARRSQRLLSWLGPDLLTRNGVCLFAREPRALDPLRRAAETHGVPHELCERDRLERLTPWLSREGSPLGLFLPEGGTLSLERLAQRLRQAAEERGVSIRTGAEVAALDLEHGRVRGVRLADGELVLAERVVDAAGAWAGLASGRSGALGLASMRRHLAELKPAFDVDARHPVCWNIETNVYVRPHGELVLACPGDETPHAPALPDVDPNLVPALRAALAREAPALAGAEFVRIWACLRTRCSDGGLAIGSDPEVGGLYWLSGLGGHGMTVGLAAGELLTKWMTGHDDPLSETFSPARFVAAGK